MRAAPSGKTVRSRRAGSDAGRVPAADLPGMPESAILVPVPEAGPVVGRLRARLDRSASRGVPAHVTVLYPFVPPEQSPPR